MNIGPDDFSGVMSLSQVVHGVGRFALRTVAMLSPCVSIWRLLATYQPWGRPSPIFCHQGSPITIMRPPEDD